MPRFRLHRARPLRAALVPAGGALALTASLGMAGVPGSATPVASSLQSAEQVAARFVVGFESYGPQGPQSASVAALATGSLAAALSAAEASGTPAALTAEGYRVTATVKGFEVAARSSTTVHLLADTVVTVSTNAGTTRTSRAIPLTLVNRHGKWRVAAASGVGGEPASASAPSAGVPAGAVPGPTSWAPSPSSTAPAAVAHVETLPTGAVGDIPAEYVALFEGAASAECPGLSWTILAGIGRVESDFGQSTLPGVHSGANSAGAEGPMQFEPATFAEYATVAPAGEDPASPYDPADAIYSAARLLCENGAPSNLYGAIFDYNHSDAYVQLVMAYAAQYDADATGNQAVTTSSVVPSGGGALASVIIADAEAYLGTPYVWGGSNPGVGFDCSGLVQWVFAEAGVRLPRVAQDQYDFGPRLAVGALLQPGDLVFFGSGPGGVEHVGIYVGNDLMIDAPHTGADVRFDHVTGFTPEFVGATRPEIPNITGSAGVPVIDTVGASGQPATLTSVTHAGSQHPVWHHPSPPSSTTSTTEGPGVGRHEGRHRWNSSSSVPGTAVPSSSTTSSTPPSSTTGPTTSTTERGQRWPQGPGDSRRHPARTTTTTVAGAPGTSTTVTRSTTSTTTATATTTMPTTTMPTTTMPATTMPATTATTHSYAPSTTVTQAPSYRAPTRTYQPPAHTYQPPAHTYQPPARPTPSRTVQSAPGTTFGRQTSTRSGTSWGGASGRP